MVAAEPRIVGPLPIRPNALVASTTRSRRRRCSTWPRITSDWPSLYTSAVSMKLIPASSARADQRIGLGTVDPAETPALAEGHRAQAELAHQDARGTERVVTHHDVLTLMAFNRDRAASPSDVRSSLYHPPRRWRAGLRTVYNTPIEAARTLDRTSPTARSLHSCRPPTNSTTRPSTSATRATRPPPSPSSKEAVAIDPNFAIGHGMLAKLYADLAEAEKAIDHAKKVVELEPDDTFSYTALSVIYQRCGKIPEAEHAKAMAYHKQMGIE